MKKTLITLVLLLTSLPVSAQITRIKDIPLTDSQANSDQWIVTDDTSDNLTKKMTLATLFAGWSGGVSLIGSPLTAETLTLKGSALNNGDVIVNPVGGDLVLGDLASTFAHAFSVRGDGSQTLSLRLNHASQHWSFQNAASGVLVIRDSTNGNAVALFESGADANSLYIDADGHVGFGADPTATNNFYVKSADTTFLSLTESTGTNAVVDFQLKNDAQTWGFQVDGGTSDRFELRDVTGATVPVVIGTTAPDNSLNISTNGRVALGGTPALSGLTIRPSGDSGSLPFLASDGLLVANTSASGDDVGAYLVSGTTGQSALFLGNSSDGASSKVEFDSSTSQLNLRNFYGAIDLNSGSLHIDSAGEVGIGTATPARALHIDDVMRIEPRSAAPTSPALGDIYVDSDTSELCFYDGSSWVGLKAAGACV